MSNYVWLEPNSLYVPVISGSVNIANTSSIAWTLTLTMANATVYNLGIAAASTGAGIVSQINSALSGALLNKYIAASLTATTNHLTFTGTTLGLVDSIYGYDPVTTISTGITLTGTNLSALMDNTPGPWLLYGIATATDIELYSVDVVDDNTRNFTTGFEFYPTIKGPVENLHSIMQTTFYKQLMDSFREEYQTFIDYVQQLGSLFKLENFLGDLNEFNSRTGNISNYMAFEVPLALKNYFLDITRGNNWVRGILESLGKQRQWAGSSLAYRMLPHLLFKRGSYFLKSVYPTVAGSLYSGQSFKYINGGTIPRILPGTVDSIYPTSSTIFGWQDFNILPPSYYKFDTLHKFDEWVNPPTNTVHSKFDTGLPILDAGKGLLVELTLDEILTHYNTIATHSCLMDLPWLTTLGNLTETVARASDRISIGSQLNLVALNTGYYNQAGDNATYTHPNIQANFRQFRSNYSPSSASYVKVGTGTLSSPTQYSSTLKDNSSQGNNGTLVGMSSASIVPRGANACLYSPGGKKVTLPAALNRTTASAWSVSIWLKTNALGSLQFFLGGAGDGSHGALLIDASGVLKFRATGGTYATLGPPVTALTWNHVVVNCDAAGNMTGYLNGTLGSTVAVGTTDTIFTTLFQGYLSGTLYEFIGYLDEFRLYNRVLTSAEITSLYAMSDFTSSGNGLLAWYSMDFVPTDIAAPKLKAGVGSYDTFINGQFLGITPVVHSLQSTLAITSPVTLNPNYFIGDKTTTPPQTTIDLNGKNLSPGTLSATITFSTGTTTPGNIIPRRLVVGEKLNVALSLYDPVISLYAQTVPLVSVAWSSPTVYNVGDEVVYSPTGVYYTCLIHHTSGTFATDLTTHKYWTESTWWPTPFRNFTDYIQTTADYTLPTENYMPYISGAGLDFLTLSGKYDSNGNNPVVYLDRANGLLYLSMRISSDGAFQNFVAIGGPNYGDTYQYNASFSYYLNSNNKGQHVALTEIGLFDVNDNMMAYGTFPPIIYDSYVNHLSTNLFLQM